jgi:AraC-like DNA-binding protein
LFHLGTPFFFLAAPSFYLYVKSLAFSDFRLAKKHLLHVLPFILILIFLFFFYHIHSIETQRILLKKGLLYSWEYWRILNLAATFQFLTYFIVDLRILKNYREEIRQQYSSVKKINLTWLNFILYIFIFSWLTSVAVFISRNYFINIMDELIIFNLLSFFLFFNFIFYKGLSQPEIFSGIEEKPKYTSSKLTGAEAEAYLRQLSVYMTIEKPYLNPTLTLKELSDQVSIPSRHLSQIINEYMHQNFYDYVSKHRIEEAKKLLVDSLNNKTVLEVLYQVGFNSKSSFNTAFKKFTGVTPSHFKKKPKNAA